MLDFFRDSVWEFIFGTLGVLLAVTALFYQLRDRKNDKKSTSHDESYLNGDKSLELQHQKSIIKRSDKIRPVHIKTDLKTIIKELEKQKRNILQTLRGFDRIQISHSILDIETNTPEFQRINQLDLTITYSIDKSIEDIFLSVEDYFAIYETARSRKESYGSHGVWLEYFTRLISSTVDSIVRRLIWSWDKIVKINPQHTISAIVQNDPIAISRDRSMLSKGIVKYLQKELESRDIKIHAVIIDKIELDDVLFKKSDHRREYELQEAEHQAKMEAMKSGILKGVNSDARAAELAKIVEIAISKRDMISWNNNDIISIVQAILKSNRDE